MKSSFHPFIGQRRVTTAGVQYSSNIEIDEIYLDHFVGKEKTVPGVAFLEMALACGELFLEQKIDKVQKFKLIKPLRIQEHVGMEAIFVNLSQRENDQSVHFKIVSGQNDHPSQVHAHGYLMPGLEDGNQEKDKHESIDIAVIKERCNTWKDGKECYKLFASNGLRLGPAFQSLKILHFNGGEALSLLELPKDNEDDFHSFCLHPSLMDGVFQTATGVTGYSEMNSGAQFVPFAIREIEFCRPLKTSIYAYAKIAGSPFQKGSQTLNVNVFLIDQSGTILVRIKGFLQARIETKLKIN